MTKQLELERYRAKSNPPQSLAEHTQAVEAAAKILIELGYVRSPNQEEPDCHLAELLQLACHYHDYGKVNRSFQRRIICGGKFDPRRELPHQLLSLFLFSETDFACREDYLLVANAVLNHHHYGENDNFGQLARVEEQALALLVEFAPQTPRTRLTRQMMKLHQAPSAILIQGLLMRCDYSASAGIPVEYVNDFLLQSLHRWRRERQIVWNELQQFCLAHQDDNLVVSAPTGMGKTEASLLWLGNNKGFYVLPLRTAINAMYARINEQLLQGQDTEQRLALLHGDNAAYCAQYHDAEFALLDYLTAARQFTLPLTICTPDQVFDCVFAYPGYERKLATLATAKVIVDEIQTYGADLLAYLLYGLHQLNDLGGRFSIFTATLPPFIKALLNEGDKPPVYAEKRFIHELQRHRLAVFDNALNSDDVLAKYRANREAGSPSNKLLVVCNTVKKAQQLYRELVAAEPRAAIYLLHSRFAAQDRLAKEQQILADGDSRCDKSVIWVTTQVVEASLDIDFDYLFTELSDLNGAFQRMGRCNRKGLKPLTEANCFLYLQIEAGLLTNADGSRGFIDSGIYRLSRKALLQAGDGILSEADKLALLDQYLTLERLQEEESCYLDTYYRTRRFLENLYVDACDRKTVAHKLRNILSCQIIPAGLYHDHLGQIQECLEQLAQPLQAGNGVEVDFKRKQTAKDFISSLSLPVPFYEVITKGQGRNIIARIPLSKQQEIIVIDCQYDSQLGFVRNGSADETAMVESAGTETLNPFL